MTVSGFNPPSPQSYDLTLTLGAGNYSASFTIGQDATVAPTSTGANAVQNTTTYAQLYNFGTVIGGPGGGMGVDFSATYGGFLKNYGQITGGAGTAVGVAGGTGVYLTASNQISHNFALISGGYGGVGAAGGIGVEVAAGSYFNNYATVLGGDGGRLGASGLGGAGGIGVDVTSGGLFLNGTIEGGGGGVGAVGGVGILMASNSGANVGGGASDPSVTTTGGVGGTGVSGIAGGTGGVGVQLLSGDFQDQSTVIGGQGGAYFGTVEGAIPSTDAGGAGGVGVYVAAGTTFLNLAGQATNFYDETFAGNIAGGAGGNAQEGFGGTGGTGLSFAAGITNTNAGAVTGGAGGSSLDSGAGGIGVSLTTGDALTNAAAGQTYALGTIDVATQVAARISGGTGGNGNVSGNGLGGGFGGAGGVGVDMVGASLTNDGTISGGGGGITYSHIQANEFSVTPHGGTGGAGIVASGGGSLTNSGVITGGVGGNGTQPPSGYTSPSSQFFVTASVGGYGGDGVDLDSSVTLDNSGSIEGGASGVTNPAGGPYGTGQTKGGAGLVFSSGTVTNSGAITGGAGTEGGIGVKIGGGELITSGTISGGTGSSYTAYAVQFSGNAATLVVDPGATFNGAVVGNRYVADTLELSGTQAGGTAITLGTQFTNFSALDFAAGAAWTVDATVAALVTPPVVDGFAQGDTLDVTNLTPLPAFDNFNASTGVLSLSNGETLQMNGSFAGEHFVFSADPGGEGTDITVAAGPACYRRGTRIRTEHGDAAIEQLAIGDRIPTLSGGLRTIRWIGHRRHAGAQIARDRDVQPVLVRAGALAQGMPHRDLWVSPEHAMYIDGMLIPARALVNGTSICQEHRLTEVTYFHLEFDAHAVIWAEGAPSESFVDEASRQMFDNAAEFHRLYPNEVGNPPQLCAPRVEEGWAVESIRLRLRQYAGAAKRPAQLMFAP